MALFYYPIKFREGKQIIDGSLNNFPSPEQFYDGQLKKLSDEIEISKVP